MNSSTKRWLWMALLLLGSFKPAHALQQVYLSDSPNGKYRVIVQQEVFRRVGDKAYFSYPITAWNLRNRHSLHLYDASVPLIVETPRGTFTVHNESIHFDWSKDSLRCFVHLEYMEGQWKTLFMDLEKGQVMDVTDELKQGIFDKVADKSWACEASKITVDHWFNAFIPVFKVTTDCGKNQDSENNKLFRITDLVFYDTHKHKVIKHCLDCDPQKVEHAAWEYYQAAIATPTPTPVPEETPGASQ